MSPSFVINIDCSNIKTSLKWSDIVMFTTASPLLTILYEFLLTKPPKVNLKKIVKIFNFDIFLISTAILSRLWVNLTYYLPNICLFIAKQSSVIVFRPWAYFQMVGPGSAENSWRMIANDHDWSKANSNSKLSSHRSILDFLIFSMSKLANNYFALFQQIGRPNSNFT